MSAQPVWKLIAQLGDADPVNYGGYFVFEDTTGVYGAEAELLQSPDDASGEWTVYRFTLDRCTLIDGILSDNPFHPLHAAWFCPSAAQRTARPQDSHLGQVADFQGTTEAELIAQFCSADPVERAEAYRAIGEYHGFENLDGYPLTFKGRKGRREVEARYAEAKYQEVQTNG